MGRRGTTAWLVAASMVGGLLGTSALAGASAAAPALQLHPNHVTAKPPHGGGGGSAWPGWASSNWSGYAETAGATPFTSATAAWTVPSAAATSRPSYSAAWVGIDGFTNSSLIQTGTEQDYYSGAAHYAAWWTTSAQGFAEQPITSGCTGTGTCGLVRAGDHMTAAISGTLGATWTMQIDDATQGWGFTTSLGYGGPGASVEWIMEAPTVGGRVAPISHYSTFAFDGGTANGQAPHLVAADGGELIQGGAVTSIPSAPDSDQDGFNSAYGAIQPASFPS